MPQQGGRLEVLLGKTSAAGDPLRPSRLLFQCAETELPARVRFLFRELPPTGGNVAWRRAWRWRVPWVGAAERLRVTGFRDYLACPFRFYLKHRLGMEPVDAAKRELDQLYRDLNEGDLRLEDHGRVMVCISVAEIDDDNDLTNRGERMRLRELLGQDLNATDEWLLVADNRYILDPSHTLEFSDEATDATDAEGEDR